MILISRYWPYSSGLDLVLINLVTLRILSSYKFIHKLDLTCRTLFLFQKCPVDFKAVHILLVQYTTRQDHFSASKILSSYNLFLFSSCSVYNCEIGLWIFDLQSVCVTRTSKKVLSKVLWTHVAAISSLASGWVFVYALNQSELTRIGGGSTITSLRFALYLVVVLVIV